MIVYNQIQSIISAIQTDFPSDSGIWIYQADRRLRDDDWEKLTISAENFVKNWKSHGKSVSAKWYTFQNRFLILVADTAEHPSGCSIDSSVNWLKTVSQNLEVDFFNRIRIAAIDINAEDIIVYPLNIWKEKQRNNDFNPQYLESLFVLDNSISKVNQLQNYLVPFEKSIIHI